MMDDLSLKRIASWQSHAPHVSLAGLVDAYLCSRKPAWHIHDVKRAFCGPDEELGREVSEDIGVCDVGMDRAKASLGCG